ncbi:MAG: sensor histidine kinase, partial [Pseudomonadota bacterium]|nr:sensor histidine kinase [Pseudomonadota bacterium]
GSLRGAHRTLGEEAAMAESYLLLLQTRMEDRLAFSIEIDPALCRATLPPLLLQPLVENAIHHGLEPKLEGGRVTVAARREDDDLVLTVADDGLGFDAATKRPGNGVALANLRQRLTARYGRQASLTLTAHHPGTVATIRLPFETDSP